MKFSVVIAAKNEEKYIGNCIKSVWVSDDVIVVDDESSDRTIEVAKSLGAKVYQRKLDGFASQKNFGIERTKYDWVMILDADERLSPELLKKVGKLQPSRGITGYNIAFRNYIGKRWLKHGGLYPDYHVRLFNKKLARYGVQEIHETLDIKKGKIKKLEGDIIHLTYRDYGEYLAKVRKYAVLEAAWSKKRPSWKHILLTFYNRYIVLRGVKDGLAGLVSAYLLAYYQYIIRREMKG